MRILTERDLWMKTLVKRFTNKNEVNQVSVFLFTVCLTVLKTPTTIRMSRVICAGAS